jgi:hypothetical protein
MRGAFEDQGGLFSYILPEARIPTSHPLRKIRELVRGVLGELNRSFGKLYPLLENSFQVRRTTLAESSHLQDGTAILHLSDAWLIATLSNGIRESLKSATLLH